ncbi:MAG: TetR/AcrR family transcriptional regulator [Cyanothece sp. SIO1E1]|nr:TetR/AcrR family transcriptional regulator [Cyanothece sp. SIO1E1]
MDKKEQIIAVATQLFAEQGFENTSVSSICEAAEVSKGLVFHHFRSKQELLREIYSRTTALIKDINATDPNCSTPQEQLKDMLESFFAGLAANKMLFQFNLNMMLQPFTRSLLQDLIDKRAAFLLQSVKAIFEEIDPENAQVLSYAFIAELDGVALHYFSIYPDYPLAEMKNHLLKKYT